MESCPYPLCTALAPPLIRISSWALRLCIVIRLERHEPRSRVGSRSLLACKQPPPLQICCICVFCQQSMRGIGLLALARISGFPSRPTTPFPAVLCRGGCRVTAVRPGSATTCVHPCNTAERPCNSPLAYRDTGCFAMGQRPWCRPAHPISTDGLQPGRNQRPSHDNDCGFLRTRHLLLHCQVASATLSGIKGTDGGDTARTALGECVRRAELEGFSAPSARPKRRCCLFHHRGWTVST